MASSSTPISNSASARAASALAFIWRLNHALRFE
eukprot:CAMPEP_0172645298 /NCGR_PEP_ID=MMETSP1068-20121228/239656_1 /TAXON_ID=35684 /ORGANISM="Pseudopedinella elastica, Strain CCMP716" /LENGTH=33 /DNA_ID= /DNA_START= /DNA_END= /DNA_ORIENTATION=